MALVRLFLAPRTAAFGCGVLGAVLALAALFLGNPVAALAAVAALGGFVYFMDRAKRGAP